MRFMLMQVVLQVLTMLLFFRVLFATALINVKPHFITIRDGNAVKSLSLDVRIVPTGANKRYTLLCIC